ncbi:hypothetical protein ASG35_03090 [Burkholderia sp. Leaf177]|uniref:hypothetical protein n=1 Tax=Burkholderia sp. Leaf177 TaxID=1736287 RepID=UPI0006F99975|nr:hypothetical protein [Burkholderia sp. Leaf177]KQR90210.1 hypothetical protein ASG35_03090 [Burkholderia sp. Leaf177]
MALDPQALYILIGRHLEKIPRLDDHALGMNPDVLSWLGKAEAYVKETGDFPLIAAMQIQMTRINTSHRVWAARDILGILHRALALTELAAPPAVAGSFIAVGAEFDAFAAVDKVMKRAKKLILVVDPYLDETILTSFGALPIEGVRLCLLTSKAKQTAALLPAANAWRAQWGNQRPVELRWAPSGSLHDRAFFIDSTEAWAVTQSFKNFAERSPGEIYRTDSTAGMKIPAYEALWARADIAA